jgi:hypothetical protein
MRRILSLLVVIAALSGFNQLAGQQLQIGIIDFYGLNRLTSAQVREALTFKEGDAISFPRVDLSPVLEDSEIRLSKLPGVAGARINPVCCDNGRVIVYVGIEETGAPTMRLRAEPIGRARLAADIVKAGDEFSKAFVDAVVRGEAKDDSSQGHSLLADAATRAIQERFLVYATRDLPQLRLVLRSSSDPVQRALAAQVLGYVADKQAVVEDLVYGMTDPSENVRNNAMRALLVFAAMGPRAGRPAVRVPYEPFVAFLNSPVWTDRNKASSALQALSASRDAALISGLRNEALGPLVEMARWKSGHARPAFTILARMAGYSDEAAEAAWDRGERELVISAALRGQ